MDNQIELVSALTSEEDESLREKPYAKLKNDIEFELDKNDLDYSKQQIDKWMENERMPLDVLEEFLSKEEILERTEYFTDCRDRMEFHPPRTKNELQNPKYAYFAGLAAGDGGFSNLNKWSIVDGGKNEKELEKSLEFIRSIRDLIHEIFGINRNSIHINERDNKIELIIVNKWFCRFIRHFFDLPGSYKKNKLKKPEIIIGKSCTTAFWRGVFDADGCVPEKSYRISLSSATKEFLEECRNDLENLGIEVTEIRKPAAYLLRISPRSLPNFAEQIGFYHPRKKEILKKHLKEGARNYEFQGRSYSNIFKGTYYDLTAIEDLRANNIGEFLKSQREEKNLYQKELGDKLNASKNQIYKWENNKSTIPLKILLSITSSKENLFQKMKENNCKFKVGVRGNQNSLVNLPLKTSENLDQLASKCVSTSKELRIRKKNDKIAAQIEEIFETTVRKAKNKHVVKNWTIAAFFSTFYEYSPKFKDCNKEEISKLERNWKI